MEKFVAVKPLLSIPLNALDLIAAWDAHTKKEDISEFEDYFQSTIDGIQSGLMREALLFDRIYLLTPGSSGDSFFANLIRGTVLANKDIFSLVSDGEILELKDPESLPKDFLESCSALLDFGGSVTKRHSKLLETVLEFLEKIEKQIADEANWDQELRDEMFLKLDKSLREDLASSEDFLARLHALKVEYFGNEVATPLLSYTSYQRKLPTSKRHALAQLVIYDLPLPNRNTAWERILEYRENPDNRQDLIRLRRWISHFSAENLSPAECMQELDWLRGEFDAHLRLHKIKTKTATLEVMIKTPLEILENLVTLRFSKLVDPLFAIKKRQVALMEAELNAPGREIAYLVKAKQSFEK